MSTMLYDKIQKMTASLLVAAVLVVCFSGCATASSLETVQVRSAPMDADTITMDGMVRVYLSSLGSPATLDLTVNGHYRLSNGKEIADGSKLSVAFSASTGELTLSYNGATFHMGRSFSLLRKSSNVENGILIAQSRDSANPYPGDLSFESVQNGSGYVLYTIAHVYIENYLYGVLPYEMGNSSGMEALKAQAVAARTYTVRMMDKRASSRYDVKDTTSDQVYRGTPSGNANCKAAVDATKGIVLMYGSDYITTYYSASNGGQTEIARSGTAYPYMKIKDDPFDYANPSSTVRKKTIYADLTSASNPAALTSLLKSRAVSALQQKGYPAAAENVRLATLDKLTPHTPMYASPSRLYTKMDFTYSVFAPDKAGEQVKVSLTETFSIFGELEGLLGLSIQSGSNELWSVEKAESSFVVQARRYGHGMGMSQRGAMYMSKLGYTYDQILGFYYDGCRRVRHGFLNTILTSDSGNQEMVVETPVEIEDGAHSNVSGTVVLASNSASLAVRASASHSAKLIGYASNGAIVEVIAQSGGWFQIRFGEIVGYVPVSSISTTDMPDGEVEPVTNILGFARVQASDFVNLRESGSMNARVLGTAPAGSVLTVFSKSGQWAKVQSNALVAYVNVHYISEVSASYPADGLSSGAQLARLVSPSGDAYVLLKDSASTNGQTILQLPAGTVVKVLSDDGSWCRVAYDQQEVYVQTEWLQYVDDDSLNSEPSEEESAPESGTDIQRAIVATEQGSLNVRALPASGSRILTTIPKGTAIEVSIWDTVWCSVRYGGHDGYVMTRYLRFAQDGEDSNTSSNGEETQQTATVLTQSGSLNLRQEPRSDSKIFARIPRLSRILVLERGSEWSYVEYAHLQGYVMSSFLVFEDEEKPDEPEEDNSDHENEGEMTEVQTAYVNTEAGSLNMRREPSLRGSFITAIPRYSAVTVLGYGDEWCAVSYNGYEGYVMSCYLRFDDQQNPSEAEPEPEQPSQPVAEETVMWVATSGGSLNLRSQPEENAGIVIEIPHRAQVTAYEQIDDWRAVSYKGYRGFVKKRYLSESKPSEQASSSESGEAFVTVDGLVLDVTLELPGSIATASAEADTPVYRMCLESEQPEFMIPAGEAVEVLMIGELWCRVDYQGNQGYCLRDKLNVRYE